MEEAVAVVQAGGDEGVDEGFCSCGGDGWTEAGDVWCHDGGCEGRWIPDTADDEGEGEGGFDQVYNLRDNKHLESWTRVKTQ